MARKILNRKELRVEQEAVERSGGGEKPAAKNQPQTQDPHQGGQRSPPEGLLGVFTQSLRRVALFEHSQRAEADKKAADLTESQKVRTSCNWSKK